MTPKDIMTLTEPIASDVPDPEPTLHTDVEFGVLPGTTTRIPVGAGWVTIDARSGAPLQFTSDKDPDRRYLLDDEVPWHSLEHAWGSGYLLAEGFAGRWSAPDRVRTDATSVAAEFHIGSRIRVRVDRRGGEALHESYVFENVSERPVTITSLGIQTPFADLYPSASDALDRRVHAHVFTGGAWSWVAAQPMNGSGPVLGLSLTRGELWGYSIETRNANTISNARGHVVLHVTDRARGSDAFGGQPAVRIDPGESYVLEWTVSWHDSVEEFVASTAAPAEFSTLRAPLGEEIIVETSLEVSAADGVEVRQTRTGARLTATEPGEYYVSLGGKSRTAVLFHDTVENTVRRRCEYVLAHQISSERPGLLARAIVPVDTSTLLTQGTNGWSDWTDGSERIGIAIMLQQARMRGWAPETSDEALRGWADFARAHLIDPSAAPRRGSVQHHAGIRLYDSPWLARFFLLRHEQHAHPDDLDLAARLIERALELGIDRFLTIGYSEVVVSVADALDAAGDSARAGALRSALVVGARRFASRGENLPHHEVAYEQAIIAPLLNLLIDAHRISGDESFIEEIRTRLPWLLAFGGPQPHARMHGVALRHWDGYWFGQRRQWGDVFPHYWSALTSTVLLRLPDSLRTPELVELGTSILRANMANYFPDGSATCAFVMPTSVDGAPAHRADPLANDQDFHLALWMQLEADGYLSFDEPHTPRLG